MKFLLALIILGMTFLSGCKQCGSAITFSDTCDPEIVSDATPVAPTPPSPGYTISSSSVNVAENGGTGTYTIVLNTEPTATVTFAITSDNTSQITVAPASVSFGSGNYSIAQTITLTGVNDNIDDDNVNVNILNAISSTDTTYGTLDNTTITAVNVDDDTKGYELRNAAYTYNEGGSQNWTVKLLTEPVDNVTATISVTSSTKDNELTLPSPVVFTPSNYGTTQTLSITARQDNEIDGTQYATVKVTLTSNDSKYNNLSSSTPDAAIYDNGTGKQPNNYTSAGNYFVLAVDNNNRLYAWGDDTCGQASGLTAETYGYCDVDQDNTSKTSDYGSGQLIPRTAENSYVIDNSSVGDNSSNVPILTGLTNIGRIASNTSNSCVLYDNRTAVQQFGRYRMSNHIHANSNNWLRQNSFTAKDIDCGYEHAAIILDNGSVVTYGYGRLGALGNSDRTVYGWNGGVIIPGNVMDLALGNNHSCFLGTNGIAVCAGKDINKELGSSTDTSNGCGAGVNCSATLLAVEGFTNIVQIDAGAQHTVGLLDNGSAICWGEASSGQCGIGSTPSYVNPPAIMTTAPANILKVYANGSKTCVVTNKYKTLHCSGPSFVGDGSSTTSSSFVEVSMPSQFTSNHIIKDVSITSGGGCVMTSQITDLTDRDMFCWGSWSSVLGNGVQAVPVRTPMPVAAPFN